MDDARAGEIRGNVSDARASPKVKRLARRTAELITAAAILAVILYWPTTNTGRLILIVLG
jgi:hypothetical protein